jgi:hypothetical protein
MSHFTDTPEKQAAREQFKQQAQEAREAIKNAPPKIKPPKEEK